MASRCDYKVSAVIPAYNAEKYLRDTICSLINQTKSLSEIIVVDDYSTDNTCAIVKSIAEESVIPINLLINACNKGASAARNKGISAALGEWILLMDSDDLAEPELLELECKRLTYLKQNSGNDWVLAYPSFRQIDENGKLISLVMRGKQVGADEIFGYEIVRNMISTSGVLLNKEVVIQNGAFKAGLKYHEDWELWLRLARIGGFAYVDEPLVRVRRHSCNTTRSMDKATLTEAEVLSNYDIFLIKAEIFKRKLSEQRNLADYVSVLYKLDCWDMGYEELDRAEAGDSNDKLLFLRGLYYIRMRLPDCARKSFEMAVLLNAGNGAAINNLGILYALSGNRVEAESSFKRALGLYPGYIDAASNLRLLESEERLMGDNFRYTWRELRPVLLNYSE